MVGVGSALYILTTMALSVMPWLEFVVLQIMPLKTKHKLQKLIYFGNYRAFDKVMMPSCDDKQP